VLQLGHVLFTYAYARRYALFTLVGIAIALLEKPWCSDPELREISSPPTAPETKNRTLARKQERPP